VGSSCAGGTEVRNVVLRAFSVIAHLCQPPEQEDCGVIQGGW